MRKTTKVQGTKIAQAAKILNVTSVTIRRYISEFSIDTATDENGIKVLPKEAMEELKEVRRLKEDGNTNPKVLEFLEERRSSQAKSPRARVKEEASQDEAGEAGEEVELKASKEIAASEDDTAKVKKRRVTRKPVVVSRKRSTKSEQEVDEEDNESQVDDSPQESEDEDISHSLDEDDDSESVEEDGSDNDGRPKHALTCQTCNKSFEHMNPRLRDCLDCYRAKRKERRRGGDKHKNVIQHPLAQQVVNKLANQQSQQQTSPKKPDPAITVQTTPPGPSAATSAQPIIGGLKTKVRSYRKAIEETRQITGSLKRRLERPDLPEGDRRWLEQIYAYQLILHQGWRHLSEYKSNTPQQPKLEDKKK